MEDAILLGFVLLHGEDEPGDGGGLVHQVSAGTALNRGKFFLCREGCSPERMAALRGKSCVATHIAG